MPKKASSKEKQTEADETAELVRYELGYHLVPLVHEESLPAEVGQIREVIEQAGGISTADQFPAARPLSYGMSRMVGGKRNESLYVREVVKRIAEIRREDPAVVQTALVGNACRVFGRNCSLTRS